MSKAPKADFRTKFTKEFPEFASEVQAATSENLDNRLAELAKGREAIEVAKDEDEALEEAQETATALAAPYRSAKRTVNLKSKFIISVLKERGVL